jgi:hypothetical protein
MGGSFPGGPRVARNRGLDGRRLHRVRVGRSAGSNPLWPVVDMLSRLSADCQPVAGLWREQARTGGPNVTPGGPVLSYEEAHATYEIVSGSPDTLIEKLQHIIDIVDPGYMGFWGRGLTDVANSVFSLPLKEDGGLKPTDIKVHGKA